MSEARSCCPGAALYWNDQSDFPLDWNGPVDRPFDAFADESKARSIVELLEAVVRRFPERIALWGPEGSISYAELWRALNGWAEQIAGATAPGELVGILTPVAPHFPIAMFACLAAGRPFVALDPGYPPEWIAQVLDDARPALLLVSNVGEGASGRIRTAARTLDLEVAARQASPGWRPARLPPDEAACVLFTSGSTGRPKGIVNSQRSLLQRVSQSINAAHINSDDRFLTLTPLCSIVGVRDIITALLAGASFCLLDTRSSGVREIHRVIRDRQITILFAFPALLRSVVESSKNRVGEFLRLVRVGGDTTLWSDIAMLRAWMSPKTSIQLVYAATEAPMMQWFVGEISSGDEERVPIGYPLPGNALAISDENGAPTPQGEVGELLVRSSYVALGTWSQGRCQATGIQTDNRDGSMRILKTGDLVRRRFDGLYDRIGRKDRQVKIRGARVELDGVEVAIRRHSSVRDVGVVVRTDGDSGLARLVAYVRPDETASDELLHELSDMMRRVAPPHMRPWRYYLVTSIPRLHSSKLDGRGLLALDLAKSKAEADERLADSNTSGFETDPIEIAVARIWRELLGLRLTAPGDDFFDLGGDSLRAITMTFELEKALGRELPMNLINRAPTFAAFCATLRENVPAPYTPLVVLKPGHGTPLFFIHGVGGCVMELFSVCRKMTWPGPVIGIQARGLDGCGPPHKSVEAMADEYLAAVRQQQPKGPYFLCGYSFGGLVAFELARRLSNSADKVAFVGLVATLPPGHHLLRLWTWTSYSYRWLAQAVAGLKARPLRAWLARATTGLDRSRARTTSSALRAVALSALSASAAYRPGAYRGVLTIFEPDARDLGVPSSALLWGRYASALRSEKIKGRHDDMLVGANAQTVADALTRCLESATYAGPRGTSRRLLPITGGSLLRPPVGQADRLSLIQRLRGWLAAACRQRSGAPTGTAVARRSD
jgi:amino acid adenylation domain-containing protein